MSTSEKPLALDSSTSQVSNDDANLFASIQAEYGVDDRRLMYKIDACVVPPFCLLYFLSFLDRVNISNANVYGLSQTLGLHGNQYNIALTVFFVPYVFFEVASNYLIKFIKPHIWLSMLLLSFGGVSIGMGFVQNFGGLVACRFLVGVAEAGTFPLIFYLLSNYYTKAESQRRFLAFFSVTALAGAALGAIAYRVHELDMRLGLESWRWLFIIEGIITCGCAVILFFTIADFPEQARFLSANEREFLKRKLEIANGSESTFHIKNTLSEVAHCFTDYLIWLPSVMYFGLIVPGYGYAYFAATIIKDMGYTALDAQAHLIYPWLAAFVVMNSVAVALDYTRRRLPYILLMCVMAIGGLVMVIGAESRPRVQYGGCFLAASGLFAAMPLVVCWHAMNMGSHLRKSVGTAWQIGFGNIGGIVATFIFMQKDAPQYYPGLGILIAMVVVTMASSGAYFYVVRRNNHRKLEASYQARFHSMSERDQVNAGDKNPKFRYLY